MMEKDLSIRTSAGDITIDPQEPPAAADTEAGRILLK